MNDTRRDCFILFYVDIVSFSFSFSRPIILQRKFKRKSFLHKYAIRAFFGEKSLANLSDTFSLGMLRWEVTLAYSFPDTSSSISLPLSLLFLVSSFSRWRTPRGMRFRATSARARVPKSAKNFRRTSFSKSHTDRRIICLFPPCSFFFWPSPTHRADDTRDWAG